MRKTFIFFLSFVGFAHAQNYQPLAPLPGITGSYDTSSLSGYLQTVFQIGIGVAAGLAVIMIVLGGIQYMSTDAIGGKEEGKDKITSALWGLLLALISFVILNTINPALVSTSLNIDQASTNGTSPNMIQPVTSTGGAATPSTSAAPLTPVSNPSSNTTGNTPAPIVD